MKYIKLLLFLAAVSLIESSLPGFSSKSCTDYQYKQTEEHQGYNKNFCRALKVTDSYDKCCYMKYKISDAYYYNCVELTPSQFNHIDDTIDDIGKTKGYDIKSLECDSSSYLYGSLLLLLAFLF